MHKRKETAKEKILDAVKKYKGMEMVSIKCLDGELKAAKILFDAAEIKLEGNKIEMKHTTSTMEIILDLLPLETKERLDHLHKYVDVVLWEARICANRFGMDDIVNAISECLRERCRIHQFDTIIFLLARPTDALYKNAIAAVAEISRELSNPTLCPTELGFKGCCDKEHECDILLCCVHRSEIPQCVRTAHEAKLHQYKTKLQPLLTREMYVAIDDYFHTWDD